LAACAIVGFWRSAGARGLLGWGLGIAAGFAAVSELAIHSLGLPLSRATPAFAVALYVAAGFGAATIESLIPLGGIVLIGAALLPAAARHRAVVEAIRLPPGILASLPESAASRGAEATGSAATGGAELAPRGAAAAPTAARPAPADPKASQAAPPPAQPRGSATWHAATAADLERARASIDGEGGMTKPALTLERDRLFLTLRLERKGLASSMAHVDAARMCLKIVRDNPSLDGLRVRILAFDGRGLSNATVPAEKVRPFLAKMDDPFESRRIRDWWPQMQE
jgi:hypothetical protein